MSEDLRNGFTKLLRLVHVSKKKPSQASSMRKL